MIDGEPWFVAADACRMLTLKSHASNGSYTGHLRRLDIIERRIVTASELPTTPSGRDGRKQSVVSESGFYKLILRCNKEVAIPFQNWVIKEVLPSIRRTGGTLCPRTSLKLRTEPLGPSCYPCSQIALTCLYGAHRRTSAEQRPTLLVEGSVRLTLRKAVLLE